ncbi:MAG: hypothetical protein LUD50_01250 [Clostridia bacterium]|nr:hypothetical protein [Clostridia bacterium]
METISFGMPRWNIEELTGYRPVTTFWDDFSIAEKYGIRAINDTYRRARYWKGSCKMWTELVMVLNHKIWQWHDLAEAATDAGQRNRADYFAALSMTYETWYEDANAFIDSRDCKWTEEERDYYFRTLD